MYMVKGLFSLYFIYNALTRVIQINIPRINVAIILLIFGSIFISIYRNNQSITLKVLFPNEIKIWLIFLLYAILSGALVATNFGRVIKYSVDFLEYLLLIIAMLYLYNNNVDIQFFKNVIIVYGSFLAIFILFSPVVGISNRYRVSAWSNENETAIILLFATVFIISDFTFQKISASFVKLIVITLLVGAIILTGSRKAFIGLLIVVILEITLILIIQKNNNVLHNIKYLILLILLIGFSLYVYKFLYLDSILQSRLEELLISGDQIRTSMYKEAQERFYQNPIFGIGLGNFEIITVFQTYSHSTYAEILASTGILGALQYFLVYVLIGVKIIKKIKLKKIVSFSDVPFHLLILFILLLFLGFGVIHYDNFLTMYIFGYILLRIRTKKKVLLVYNYA